MLQDLHGTLTPGRQANIFALGLSSIFVFGLLGIISACFAALWLVVQFVSILLSSIVECCSTIATTFAASDPLVKFLILLAIGFVCYRIARKVWRV